MSPIVGTVGNISDTINTSEFVKGVRDGAETAARESPALMETKVEMVDNTMQVGVINQVVSIIISSGCFTTGMLTGLSSTQ